MAQLNLIDRALIQLGTRSDYLRPALTFTILEREYCDMTSDGKELLSLVHTKVLNKEFVRIFEPLECPKIDVSRSGMWFADKDHPHHTSEATYSAICTWANRVLTTHNFTTSPIIFFEHSKDGQPGWVFTKSGSLYQFTV